MYLPRLFDKNGRDGKEEQGTGQVANQGILCNCQPEMIINKNEK